MNPKLKNILIFAGIFILLVVAYVIFFGNKEETPALVTTGGTAGSSTATTTTGTSAVGREFLTTLLNIRNIKLDDSIFSDPAFASLQDFELTLIQETNPGRTNPFLPLGSDTSSATVTSSTTSSSTTTTGTPPTSPTPTTTPTTTPTGSGTSSAGFPTSPTAPAAGN